MKGYEEYKTVDSNWLESLPCNWELLPLQSQLQERKEKNDRNQTSFILSLTAAVGVIPYSEKKTGGNKAKDDITKYNIAHENDLIVNCMNVVAGSSGMSKYYGAISPVYYALYVRNDSSNIRYWEYIFRNKKFYSSLIGLGNGIMMKKSSTGKLNTVRKRIPMNKLNRVMLPVPSKSEQDQIVRYLDWKVSEMNCFIREKKKQIKLLKEYRENIICYYTHRGLIEDRKLYPSEFPWIEGVPDGWAETRLKYVLTKLSREREPEYELLICSNKGKVFFRGDSKLGLVADDDSIYQGVKAGDLLIHGMDTWHGAIAISDYDGMCTGVVHVCSTKENKRYIMYYLQSLAFKKVYKKITNGVRENTSDFRSWDKAGQINLLLPPIEEQNEIARVLDEKCEQIENLIQSLEEEIAYIEELKIKLIADVVTGQVDVRDEIIPDYTSDSGAEALENDSLEDEDEEFPSEEE